MHVDFFSKIQSNCMGAKLISSGRWILPLISSSAYVKILPQRFYRRIFIVIFLPSNAACLIPCTNHSQLHMVAKTSEIQVEQPSRTTYIHICIIQCLKLMAKSENSFRHGISGKGELAQLSRHPNLGRHTPFALGCTLLPF